MKHCNTCNKDKSKLDFGNRKASPDGLSPKCKLCQSEYDKARANNKDRVLARKNYAKTEAGKEAGNRAKRNGLVKTKARFTMPPRAIGKKTQKNISSERLLMRLEKGI